MFNLLHSYKSLTLFIRFNLNGVETGLKQSVKPKELNTTAEEIIKLKEENFCDTKNLREKFKSYIDNIAKNNKEDGNQVNSGEKILSNKDLKGKDREAINIIVSYINEHQKIEKNKQKSIYSLNLEMGELVSDFKYKIDYVLKVNEECRVELKDLNSDVKKNIDKKTEILEVDFKDYKSCETSFNSLSEEDKITLQETIGANPDGNFGKKTYAKLTKFVSKNKGIKTFSDIIGNDSNITENSIDVNDKEFVKQRVEASAYYSPLVGQRHYATGSYRGDIILQGPGKRTKSGKTPKVGMVAMDGVEFGTKVIMPDKVVKNLGAKTSIFSVEDIGGAIKNKKIDIYFGKGDDALKRSLEFGRKKIDIQVAKSGIEDKPEKVKKSKNKQKNTKLA